MGRNPWVESGYQWKYKAANFEFRVSVRFLKRQIRSPASLDKFLTKDRYVVTEFLKDLSIEHGQILDS